MQPTGPDSFKELSDLRVLKKKEMGYLSLVL